MDRREWLLLSDERDLQDRRVRAAWEEGRRYGWSRGYEAGRDAEAADRENAWRRNAGMIVAQVDPSSPQARQLAAMRVRAAESGQRRDHDEHWHEFVKRAGETPEAVRTEQQKAVLGDR